METGGTGKVRSKISSQARERSYLCPDYQKISVDRRKDVESIVKRLKAGNMIVFRQLVDLLHLSRIYKQSNMKEESLQALKHLQRVNVNSEEKRGQVTTVYLEGLLELAGMLPQDCTSDLKRIGQKIIDYSAESDVSNECRGIRILAGAEVREGMVRWENDMMKEATTEEEKMYIDIQRRDMANFFEDKGVKAVKLLEKGIKKARWVKEKIDSVVGEELVVDLTFELARAYQILARLDNDYMDKSIEAYGECYYLAKKAELSSFKVNSLVNLAVVYMDMEKYESALEKYKEQLGDCHLKENHDTVALIRFNMAKCYREKKKYEEARHQIRLALMEAEKISEVEERENMIEDIREALKSIQKSEKSYWEFKDVIRDKNTEVPHNILKLNEEQMVTVIGMAESCGSQLLFLKAVQRSFEMEKLDMELPSATNTEIPGKLIGPFSESVKLPDLEFHRLSELIPIVKFFCSTFTHSKRTLVAFRSLLNMDPLYKPLTVLIHIVMISKNEEELTEEEFVFSWVELAGGVDDWCERKRKLRMNDDVKVMEVPECIEVVYCRALEVAIKSKVVSMVCTCLVNLEIIYKKYGDSIMEKRVGEEIEKFKRFKTVEKIKIEVRARFGMIPEKKTQVQVKKEMIEAEEKQRHDIHYRMTDPVTDSFRSSEDNSMAMLLGSFASNSFQHQPNRSSAPEKLEEQKPAFKNILIPSVHPSSSSSHTTSLLHSFDNRPARLEELIEKGNLLVATPVYLPLGPYLPSSLTIPPFNIKSLFTTTSLNLSQTDIDTPWLSDFFKCIIPNSKQNSVSLQSMDISRNRLDSSLFSLFAADPNNRIYSLCIQYIQCIDLRCNTFVMDDRVVEFERGLNRYVKEVLIGAVKVQGEDAQEQRKNLMIVFERLVMRPVIERLVFGGCSLVGMRGMDIKGSNLRRLEVQCNLIVHEEIAWIIIECSKLFPKIKYLDLSSQIKTQWNGKISRFLYDSAESHASYSETPGRASNSNPERVLYMRDNSSFIEFVVSAFEDDRESVVWLALQRSLSDFSKIVVQSCNTHKLDHFISMMPSHDISNDQILLKNY